MLLLGVLHWHLNEICPPNACGVRAIVVRIRWAPPFHCYGRFIRERLAYPSEVKWKKLEEIFDVAKGAAVAVYVFLFGCDIVIAVYGLVFDRSLMRDALFLLIFINPLSMCLILMAVGLAVAAPLALGALIVNMIAHIPIAAKAFNKNRGVPPPDRTS